MAKTRRTRKRRFALGFGEGMVYERWRLFGVARANVKVVVVNLTKLPFQTVGVAFSAPCCHLVSRPRSKTRLVCAR